MGAVTEIEGDLFDAPDGAALIRMWHQSHIMAALNWANKLRDQTHAIARAPGGKELHELFDLE